MKKVFFEKHISLIEMNDRSVDIVIREERWVFKYDGIEGLRNLNVWVICEDREEKHISKYFI